MKRLLVPGISCGNLLLSKGMLSWCFYSLFTRPERFSGGGAETGGWSWTLPAWTPTLGEGTELPGQAFQADPALVALHPEPALSPLSRQNCLNQFGRLREAKGL